MIKIILFKSVNISISKNNIYIDNIYSLINLYFYMRKNFNIISYYIIIFINITKYVKIFK